jgi:PAS domain S-box-containing protein
MMPRTSQLEALPTRSADGDAYARLREQVADLPLALIEWDGDQRVVGYSARAQEVFGFAPEEVLGKRYDEIPWVQEEDWPMARAEAELMRTTGKRATVTVVRNRRRDGTPIHCEWYSSAQRDASGGLVSMISLVLDVTGRVRAEEALRVSEARARAVMENVRDQLAMFEPIRNAAGVITDWRCVDANAAAQELLGSGSELVGKTLREILGDGVATARHALFARVLETGAPHRYEAPLGGRTLLSTLFRIDGPRVVSASVDITDRKRIEERAESLARFPRENPDPVLRLAADGTVDYANEAAVRALGVEPGRPASEPLAVIAREAVAAHARRKEELAVGAAAFSAVFAPVGDEVNVYAQDISARKRAEEALRESEVRLRRLVEANPIGVVEGDASGGVVEANEAFLRIIGHTREELAAGAIRWDAITPPEHLPADRRAVADALARGVSSVYEKEYFGADGRRVPVLVACASFGSDGGLVAFVADITDRKRAEEALRAELVARERRETHQAVLAGLAEDFARLATEEEITRAIGARLGEHLGISVCSLADIDGGVCTVRAAFRADAVPTLASLRISDYVSDAVEIDARLGKTVVIRDARTDARVDGARCEALGVCAAVMVPLHRDGAWRHSFQVGAPAPRDWREDEVLLLQDVAARLFPRIERARAEDELRRSNEELRAARARLEEADRRKDEFLAVLSHELRNPLAPIRNSIQLLDHAASGEVARRAREVVRRQTEHLVRIVSDLLDVTRITHGKIDLRLGRVDARELARRTFTDSSVEFEQHGVELHFSQAGEPVWVEADEARLGQMVTNLLNNALKFTPRGGQVHLGVHLAGGACEVRVRDGGIGIAAEDLGRIFEPFVQVERTRRTHGGVGIGLALVRQLAQLQGGTVHAESDGPGTGAEFVIRLPLAPAPEGAHPSRPSDAAAAPLSILVVDDNEDAAVTLADLLRLLGHSVATAGCGSAGIEAAAAQLPGVLLCDVGLPDMSGYDVIRAVRGQPGGGGVFAVALTGYAQPHDRELAMDAGFDAHLGKPAGIEELEEVLARAARARPEEPRPQLH